MNEDDGEPVVNSTGPQGSVLLTSMSATDCFIVLPAAPRCHRRRDLIGIRHWAAFMVFLLTLTFL
ncbi:MAG: hypothetical protein ACREXS_21925 [Gammaproteobacteria bacterium]